MSENQMVTSALFVFKYVKVDKGPTENVMGATFGPQTAIWKDLIQEKSLPFSKYTNFSDTETFSDIGSP